MNKRKLLSFMLFHIVFIGILFSSPFCQAAEKIWSTHIFYATESEEQREIPLAAIQVSLTEGYHTYAHGSNADMPMELTLQSSDGSPVAATIFYPPGQVQPDIFEPDKQILAYTGDFFIFIRPDTLPASRSFTVSLSFLACSSRNCVPVMDRFSLVFPASLPALNTADWKDAYQVLALSSGTPRLDGTAQSSDPALSKKASPISPTIDAAQTPYPDTRLSVPYSLPNLSPRVMQDALEPTALSTALLLGLLAGLVLNVMPCVLPVLTMKISALLSASGHTDARIRMIRFREHNLLFAAGILTWFLILALCIGVFELAWGGLFQDSRLVFGLLLLVFLLALSLFDVFTLPILDFKIGASTTPRLQAYLTGLVATLLATPCSGPLLGGVLGWAALQPLPVIVAVFMSTGIGMALPYLLLTIWPGGARILPKPGPWTGIMERLVGFFLMGTALYLLSILPENFRLKALVVLLVAALAAWIWGRWGSFHATGLRKTLVGILVLTMLGGSTGWAFIPRPDSVPWISFNMTTFHSLWRKEPLFVEFTADWCPSCKVLEHTVLTPSRLEALTRHYGVQLLRVDLTRPDPDGEALLRALGSVSIPVAAIFPAGDEADHPLVLRDLYTAGQLENAFETLLPRKR